MGLLSRASGNTSFNDKHAGSNGNEPLEQESIPEISVEIDIEGEDEYAGEESSTAEFSEYKITGSDFPPPEDSSELDFSLTGSDEEIVSLDTVEAVEEVLTEEVLTEEVLTEEVLTEEVLTEEVLTEEVLTEEVLTEEVLTEEVLTEKVPTEEVLTEEEPAESVQHIPEFSLDDMGKALKERIGRLSRNSSTPYTALSLLKAYSAFQTGICLSLQSGIYSSYTSVGLGIDKISIPCEKIWSEEKAGLPFFRLDSASKGENQEIISGHDNLCYWIFPLGGEAFAKGENSRRPWTEIMILGVHITEGTNSDFNPEYISAIVKGSSEKFLTGTEKHAGEPVVVNIPAGKEYGKDEAEIPIALKEKIAEYHRIHADFNCILLDIPESSDDDDKSGFLKNVSKMLNMTGTVLSLGKGYPLILLPKMYDLELITHRISRSLNIKPLKTFEASSPENVFNQIKSLL